MRSLDECASQRHRIEIYVNINEKVVEMVGALLVEITLGYVNFKI